MENDVKQRVNEFRRWLELSILAFSKVLGIGQTTLNQQLSDGKRGVSVNVLLLILSAYPNLSAEWLMRGEGNMIKGDVPKAAVVKDDALIAALHDHIATLKETNARLAKEVEQLRREKIAQNVVSGGFVKELKP